MKRFVMTTVVLLLMLLAGTTQGRAADHVRLTINDGLADMTLKAKMENAVSELLTELNYAAEQNRKPRLNGLAMTEQAKSDVMRLWDNVHLYCFEPEVVQKCLTTMHGYQVRGLPVVMIPVGEDESKQEYQEVVVSFSKKGEMESFFLTIAMHLYQEVMKNSGTEIGDIRRRMQILDYVEHFRTSYNQKDLGFLRQVFSDDALIITGRVIKTQKSEVFPSGNKIIYKEYNKSNYLSHLSQVFRNNRYIKVNFDGISIVHHPTKANVYGVTLHQSWNSGRYHDEGYVFMIWDFNDEQAPKIHVRTWQPDYLDEAKGQRLPEDEIFTLGDFIY
ncbi:MAG: nuclear transport factor 2 family protein [Prevotella sp.]|nr:nuclear transport factor 2 family protein [Prevotella sp.]